MSGMTLCIRGLGKRFGRHWVFRGLDLELGAGESLVVAGPNGSGKSTLLRIIAGLIPPTEGEAHMVLLGGSETAPNAEAGAIGALPHVEAEKDKGSKVHVLTRGGANRNLVGLSSPEQSLYEALTGLENLRFFARLRGLPSFSAEECLAKVGLAGRGDDRVATYSTGMKQRLRLAVASLHDPPLLLLDEPGAGLDEDGRALVATLIDRFRQNGVVIVATNDRREYKYAERRLELAC